MHTKISAIARTLHRILHRLSRKARIKLGITVSLPPFLKIALDYSADIGEPANDNKPQRRPHRTA